MILKKDYHTKDMKNKFDTLSKKYNYLRFVELKLNNDKELHRKK